MTVELAGERRGSAVGLPARPGYGPARSAALVGLLVVGGTLLQLLRQPGVPSWDSLLAEDGGIFLTDALNRPGLANLIRPYEGYLHVVPRLLAALSAALPLQAAAVVLSGGAALVVSLLCLWIYVASGSVFRTRWARVLLVLLVLLLPAAGYEAQATINNLHWYLNFACFWVFVRPLRGRCVVAVGALVATAAVMSDPLAGLFVPLAAYRGLQALGLRPAWTWPGSWRSADRSQNRSISAGLLLAPVAFALAMAAQFVLGVASGTPRAFVPVNLADLPAIYGLRVAGSLLVGDRFLQQLYADAGLVFAYGCLAVAALAVAGALLGTCSVVRRLVALAAAYSLLWLTVPLLLRGTSIYLDRVDPTLLGSRYMINPVLFLAVALLVWADHRAARPDGATALRVAATCWLVAVLVGSFQLPSIRQAGPSWQQAIADAAQRCATGGGDAEASATPGPAVVPVAPVSPTTPFAEAAPAAWNVVVDCDRLR